ncbi:DUF4352 domain-containing protein [Schumannella sp. 10F1B-5-1]|uniref:DUF4352 domain-containing protein n=1 Tax=Schumannella sp. 10F1B-5-1 TaxID=2590780 RepID=UPI0011328FE5|nr:DUF4352 domain-containing protein [Schumannella sp. 10F1B-5-1]TPW70763.1 DUF4352 domain-containing protein [Schumannella sp. 10F1B-5-1]
MSRPVLANRPLRILVALALLAVGMFAAATAPSGDDGVPAEFLVRAEPGEVVTTRLLHSRLDGAQIARSVTTTGWRAEQVRTTGRWVVVTLTLQTRDSSEGISSSLLVIDGVEYSSYTGFDGDLSKYGEGPGVAQRGAIAFEVPAAALETSGAEHAEVRLQTQVAPKLDDVPVFTVDLASASRVDDLELPEPELVKALAP